jgi:glyoxylase-like metal-dependent hydrolase (beta-lactamase superfamily II)
MVSKMYGIPYTSSPEIDIFLEEGEKLSFGNSQFDILFTPGHSPASVSFYNDQAGILIAGDVLFQGSIGRTDLPGGSFETLEQSIKKKLYTLPDTTRVLPGHGPETTIGIEKVSNPFVRL